MKVSLLDYLAEQFNKLKARYYPLNETSWKIIQSVSLNELIDDDSKCLDFIFSELDFETEITSNNKNRASHIVVTWLLGLGLGDFFSINANSYSPIEQGFYRGYYSRIWLLTSFVHDYGYFCGTTENSTQTISKIQGKYPLLTDHYDDSLLNDEIKWVQDLSTKAAYNSFYSFSYDEIINYFGYRKEALSENNDTFEKLDHGIVGGCIAFKRYCQKIERELSFYKPAISELQMYKIACYIAASHNIFMSPNASTDSIYLKHGLGKLLSYSPIRITRKNPLLLLLSLVDTIECTKRFSAKSNPRSYLQQSTCLNYVQIDFENNELIINFESLRQFILKEKRDKAKSDSLINSLVRHIDGVASLCSWTDCSSMKNPMNNDEVFISFPG